MQRLLTWLQDTRGDLVWTTMVLVAVLIPLGGLSIDVSRYFLLRSTLATGADAAAAAAAQCLDITHFQNTGDVRLLPDCATAEAHDAFVANVADLDAITYHPQFTSISIDEGLDEVDVNAQGDIRLIFGMTPAFTVEVQASSRYRMESR